MKRLAITIATLLFGAATLSAQQVLPLYEGVAPGSENRTDTEQVTYNQTTGEIERISSTSSPSITVYLPSPDKATGKAVILCSGGAMMFHSWGNDVVNMARWLNERGVAAIGLKYRLKPMTPPKPRPQGGQSRQQGGQPRQQGGQMPPMMLNLDITQFDQLVKSNADPAANDAEGVRLNMQAVDDARVAMRLVRSHAEEWNIDPEKVGFLGFSAGGGVAIGATVTATTPEEMPSFLATIYGPSLMEVEVPISEVPLFIATRAEHRNVAAGVMSLFMDWKRAGQSAEMHIYADPQGAFGPDDTGLPSGSWRESFFRWLNYTIE